MYRRFTNVETVLGTGIAYIPIADMPPLNAALVWPRQTRDPRLRAFVEAARAVLRTAS